MALKVSIVVPPLRTKVSFYPPFGALSIIAIAEEAGHDATLIDLDANRCSLSQAVERVMHCNPDIVGISAVVSTSYKYVKDLSAIIRQKYPDVIIMIGGGLAAAAETVLKNTAVDIAVHGEGEDSFKEFLKRMENKQPYDGITGISFKKNGMVIKTMSRKLMANLDVLPFPDYDRLDLNKYVLDIGDFIKGYGDKNKLDKRLTESKRSPRFLRIIISRGCVGSCTFCYRNMPGLRIHSFKYIGDLIAYVKDRYNIGHVSFADECFGPGKEWLWNFIKMVKDRNFDLTYHITGMRVDIVDEGILKALKEIGVWHIQFGFESGSQKILNVMEKRTTVKQNIQVVRMLEKVGINTIPFIILGYPGENTETVQETISFLRKANLMSKKFRPTFPMAMPGTSLFEYARLKGYIMDEDKYLEAISDVEAENLSERNYFINYTGSPTHIVEGWMTLFRGENIKQESKYSLRIIVSKIADKIKKEGWRKTIHFVVSRLDTLFKAQWVEKKYLQNCKTDKVNENQTLSGEIPDTGESLRKINQRLRVCLQQANAEN